VPSTRTRLSCPRDGKKTVGADSVEEALRLLGGTRQEPLSSLNQRYAAARRVAADAADAAARDRLDNAWAVIAESCWTQTDEHRRTAAKLAELEALETLEAQASRPLGRRVLMRLGWMRATASLRRNDGRTRGGIPGRCWALVAVSCPRASCHRSPKTAH